jgi:predicted dehydrogenase
LNKLNIAVIGLSGIGLTHVRAILANDHTELAGVCASRESSLAKARELAPGVFATTQVEELLQQDGIDAVVVATPDHYHAVHTIAALESGKHVLCEKPMADKLDDCIRMVETAKKAERALFVGQVCRFSPGFLQAKRLLNSGAIGELFFVESEYAHNFDDVGAGKSWRTDPAIGREQMVGGGCHAADIVRMYCGNAVEVQAYSNHKVLKSWSADDTMIGIYKFANGAIGKVFTSGAVRRDYTMRTVLYGSKGSIIVDNKSDHLHLYSKELDTSFMGTPNARHTENYAIAIPTGNNTKNVPEQLAAFVKTVQEGNASVESGQSGANTVAMCTATVEAAKTGQAVTIRNPFPES